jgi:hypothetical protein
MKFGSRHSGDRVAEYSGGYTGEEKQSERYSALLRIVARDQSTGRKLKRGNLQL